MVGLGSGLWQCHFKKATVEESLILSISQLVQRGALQANHQYSDTWSWTRKTDGRYIASVEYFVNTKEMRLPSLRLKYNRGQRDYDYYIELSFTAMQFGGVRWWFHCPLLRKGKECFNRVVKLYRAPESNYFGCRQCQNLTYESCQTSDKRVSRLRNDPAALAALTAGNLERLNITELALLLKVIS